MVDTDVDIIDMICSRYYLGCGGRGTHRPSCSDSGGRTAQARPAAAAAWCCLQISNTSLQVALSNTPLESVFLHTHYTFSSSNDCIGIGKKQSACNVHFCPFVVRTEVACY